MARKRKLSAQEELFAELERVMPEKSTWYGKRTYDCRICGSIVNDRVIHLRWHRGSEMLDVLTKLFGRSN